VRVVADTNVLVSALIFPGGSPEAFYRLVLEGQIELVTSRPLLVELGRVLVDKFGWEPQRAEEAVEQVIRLAEIVEPREAVSELEADPADNRVLEAAAEGGADAIVSGDRHLLGLGSWRGIPIEAPAAFLSKVASPSDESD
jgi:putative PIN family toxin of toxin-antitoxin system